jgi:hypothetical protein
VREIRMLRCVSREGWRVQQESVLPGQKSEPRSLDSGGEGNRTFEAYRQGLPRGEVTSHRAVTKVNALWPRKCVFPRAEPST